MIWEANYVENLGVGDGVIIDMVKIPAGKFLMGSLEGDRPQQRVAVESFWMGKFPVTQDLWQAVATLPRVERVLYDDPSSFKGGRRPVETVSWCEAQEFCKRISQKACIEYRLPTESEWEYACRGGTTTPFNFGKTISTDLANYNGQYTYNSGPKGEFRKQTTPVDLFPPNAFGLSDMHGNVWEWCQDRWHGSPIANPLALSVYCEEIAWLTSRDIRVVRGGSWSYGQSSCRSECRNYMDSTWASDSVGFRVVCT